MTRLSLLLLLCGPLYAQNEWTQRVIPPDYSTFGVAGRRGLYLCNTLTSAGNGNYYYLRSMDGTSWTLTVLPRAENIYASGQRIIGLSDYSGFWWTDDGVAATPASTGGVVDTYRARLAVGAAVLVCVDYRGHIFRSADNGMSWIPSLSPASLFVDVAWGGGQFIAYGGGANTHNTARSSDGITWTIGSDIPGDGLCYALGTWRTGTHRSPDAQTWTVSEAPFWWSVNDAPDSFYCWSGREFRRLTTGTGSSWDSILLPILDPIFDIQHCGDLWIATAVDGKLLTAPAAPPLPLQTAPVTINSAVALSWPTQAGRSYVVQRSTDNLLWANATAPMLGDGSPLQWFTLADEGREFFRVQAR